MSSGIATRAKPKNGVQTGFGSLNPKRPGYKIAFWGK